MSEPTTVPASDGFSADAFSEVARLMRKYSKDDEDNLRAVLSNNFNIILAGLDRAAAEPVEPSTTRPRVEFLDVCYLMSKDICERLVGKQRSEADVAKIAAYIERCATTGALALVAPFAAAPTGDHDLDAEAAFKFWNDVQATTAKHGCMGGENVLRWLDQQLAAPWPRAREQSVLSRLAAAVFAQRDGTGAQHDHADEIRKETAPLLESLGLSDEGDGWGFSTESLEATYGSSGPPHPLAAHPGGAKPGLYIVHWKSGGTSKAAIGMMPNGDRWIAPTNWQRPGLYPNGGEWADIERLEPILLADAVTTILTRETELWTVLRPILWAANQLPAERGDEDVIEMSMYDTLDDETVARLGASSPHSRLMLSIDGLRAKDLRKIASLYRRYERAIVAIGGLNEKGFSRPRLTRDYRALFADAMGALIAFDDWTNVNETEFTGWGEGVVPPAAEWMRVKSGQALKALQELLPSMAHPTPTPPRTRTPKIAASSIKSARGSVWLGGYDRLSIAPIRRGAFDADEASGAVIDLPVMQPNGKPWRGRVIEITEIDALMVQVTFQITAPEVPHGN